MHREPRAVREGTEQPRTRSRAVAGDGGDKGGLPEISARFPHRVEPTSLKAFCRNVWGQVRGRGRLGRKGPAQAVAFCSPAPPDPALVKEVAYHWFFIPERASRAGEESESLPASSH